MRIKFFIIIFNYIFACALVYASEDTKKYIAHAGGAIDGYRYTNSLDALEESYHQGFRYFELDLIYTKDNQLVASHDWNLWSEMTGCQEKNITKKHFLEHKIYEEYSPLTMDEINIWFGEHEDAVLVTDKINSPSKMLSFFNFKDRLLMELFTFEAIDEAQKCGVDFMLSEGLLASIKGDKLEYFIRNNIKKLAVNRNLIDESNEYKKLFLSCKEKGIKVYAFGLDPYNYTEEYVFHNEMQYFYGMYADNWIDEFSMPLSILDVNSGKLKVYYTGNLFNVESESEIKSIAIYNVSGKLLANYADINNLEFQTLIEHNDGLLIIKIETTDSSKILKLF